MRLKRLVSLLLVLTCVTLSRAEAQSSTPEATAADPTGDFRVYFLDVENGLKFSDKPDQSENISILKTALDSFNIQSTLISTEDFAKLSHHAARNSPSAGEVLVIPGGTTALTDEELNVVRSYVSAGGNLVILASDFLDEHGQSLATDEQLNQYLWESFGLRYQPAVVLDPVQKFAQRHDLVATTYDPDSFITTNVSSGPGGVILRFPHPIEFANRPPQDVTTTALIKTSTFSYATTDFGSLLSGKYVQSSADLPGPFVVTAQAINADTGSRIVLLGSTSFLDGQLAQLSQADNYTIAFNSLIWTTRFNDSYTAAQADTTPTPPPTLAPRTTSAVMIDETFDNNDLDWETAAASGVTSQLKAGRYVIDLTNEFSGVGWVVEPGFHDRTRAPQTFGNFDLQMDVSDARCGAHDCFLDILYNAGRSDDKYDLIMLGSDTTARILDRVGRVIAGGDLNPEVHVFDGLTHTIRLHVENQQLQLFVDDALILTAAQASYELGTFGFGLSRGTRNSKTAMHAAFDHLMLTLQPD